MRIPNFLPLHRPLRTFILHPSAFILFAAAAATLRAQDARPLFRDPSQPIEARVADVLKQLTLEEKVSMVHGNSNWTSGGIPRLGLPPIWMDDGPLGVREESGGGYQLTNGTDDAATGMPATLGLAATWNPKLAYSYGTVIGAEALRRGKNIMLGPSLNIQRTPLCGRNFEYMGEDPFLTSRIAVGYIQGQASEGITGTAKHFAANNQEVQRNTVDARVDERTLREIYFPAFKAAVQEGGVLSVMGSYNFLNGQHACESDYLLNQVLKKDWGYKGLVESDWGGVHDTKEAALNGMDIEMPGRGNGGAQNFLADAYLQGLQNGTYPLTTIDGKVSRILYVMIELGMLDTPARRTPLPIDAAHPLSTKEHQAIARQVAEESIVLLKNDGNLLPLDPVKYKTIAVIGDNAQTKFVHSGGSALIKSPYEITALDGILSRAGAATAISYSQGYRIPAAGGRGAAPAAPAVQLTMNTIRTGLTLTDEQATAIAPIVDEINQGQTNLTAAQTANATLRQQGIDRIDAVLTEAQRTGLARFGNPSPTQLIADAVATAKAADLVIYVGGLIHDGFDSEDADRPNLKMPFGQDELLKQVIAANPKTVVVLLGGGALEMPWLDQTPALLYEWYPGLEGGNALAGVLFGDVNPSGKLPCTFPKKLEDTPTASGGEEAYPGIANPDLPPAPAGGRGFGGRSGGNALVPQLIETYKEALLVGYRWYDTKKIEPLFSFGHGLSYTTFIYSNLRLTATGTGAGMVVNASFEVTNTGAREGAEVAELYVHQDQPALMRPEKELKGFQKISLRPGASQTVSIPLGPRAFAYYDTEKKGWLAEGGDFQIMVGGSSRDLPLKQTYRWPETLLLPP